MSVAPAPSSPAAPGTAAPVPFRRPVPSSRSSGSLPTTAAPAPPAPLSRVSTGAAERKKFSDAQLNAASSSPLLKRASAAAPPPPPSSSSSSSLNSPSLVRRPAALPPAKLPPPPPRQAAISANAVLVDDHAESLASPEDARPHAVSDPVEVESSSGGGASERGSWKGVTTRSSGRQPPAVATSPIAVARARGSTALSNNNSPPNLDDEGVPNLPDLPTGDGSAFLSPASSGRLEMPPLSSERPPPTPDGRRWSFLASEEEATVDADNAQCYIWGVVNRQIRSLPKAPKLEALGEANVKRVVGGSDHFLLLTDSGLVFSWGHGTNGALGLGDTMSRWTPTLIESIANQHMTCIAAARHHSAAISERGSLFNWGTLGVPGFDATLVPKSRSELKVIFFFLWKKKKKKKRKS